LAPLDRFTQAERPPSVLRGLQRIRRAGHQVGEPSKGVIFPKYRGDLLETAVVVKGMHDGAIEETVLPLNALGVHALHAGSIAQTGLPPNPVDVPAQQLVAMTIGERFTVDELLEIVRRAAP